MITLPFTMLFYVLKYPGTFVVACLALGVIAEWQKHREKAKRHAELLDAVRAATAEEARRAR